MECAPAFRKSLSLYPEKEAEISHFIMKLSSLLAGLFSTETMSEENAIAVVSQHVIGPSFVLGLRFGGIHDEAFKELRTALETLAHKWEKREYVSKIAAGAMISIQDLFTLLSGIYSEEEKRRLQPMLQALNECITRCLS
ncbi:MAG: hypothetical protein H0U76_17400 [Ktedonobacteraceae bacterium]|nr:hypothetical protein [Ktedonobacteraceae bacterium]